MYFWLISSFIVQNTTRGIQFGKKESVMFGIMHESAAIKMPKDEAWWSNVEILEKFYFEYLLPNCY